LCVGGCAADEADHVTVGVDDGGVTRSRKW
jgi:hypothetical protein